MIDTINTRRSVRKFTPEPVPEETIAKILEAGQKGKAAGK
ncbi:MAG: nitroreductase family protein [Spirochaetes bacterium]|jgi:nitroreductase|nr:nitroreductase family protein [Spirochaetota bacterium]